MEEHDPDLLPLVDRARRSSEMTLLSQHISSVILDIRELRKEIRDMRAPNYQILIGLAMLLLAGGGALWGLAISPFREELSKFATTFAAKDIVEEKFAEAAKERLILAEQFKNYATKDDLNRVIIDVDRRLPRK